jgi:hypothetical protein
MASASRFKYLNTLYTNSLKLIGSRGHVTVDAQKRPKLSSHSSCRSVSYYEMQPGGRVFLKCFRVHLPSHHSLGMDRRRMAEQAGVCGFLGQWADPPAGRCLLLLCCSLPGPATGKIWCREGRNSWPFCSGMSIVSNRIVSSV